MKARWLRLGHPPPPSQYIRHPSLHQAPRLTLVPSRLIRGGVKKVVELDLQVEESFFPSKPTLDLKVEAPFFPPKPSQSQSSSLAERRLLGKARLNGIDSLEKLIFEADIGHTEDVGSRMTDKPEHRQDFDLWLLLLAFQQHRNGLEGAKKIWSAMMSRGEPVEFDSRNRNASDLVQSIITSAVDDVPFLKSFAVTCVQRNIFSDQLFTWLIGSLLLHNPEAAPKLCIKLRDTSFRGKDNLMELLAVACRSETTGAMEGFCKVRTLLPDFRIYDDALPLVWDTERSSSAFVLHDYLIARDDVPKHFEALKPFVQHIYDTEGDIEDLIRGLATANISFEAQIYQYYSYLSTKTSPESHPSRTPSDETVARALATFPFEFAIKSLKFFGLIEVGPLSVREMVRSSSNSRILTRLFKKLKTFEIDTGSSTYIRLVKKLLAKGAFRMIKDLSESDMHHDEYDNRILQHILLKQYFKRADYRQMNNTLTILNRGRFDSSVQKQSITWLLRSAIYSSKWTQVLNLTNHIRHEGFDVDPNTVGLLIQKMLRPKVHTARSFDKTGFLIGILQRFLAAGIPVQSSSWRRPLIVLGLHGRLVQLESLAMWLADFYSSHVTEPHGLDMSVSSLFTPKLQSALISLSFTSLDWKTKSHNPRFGSEQVADSDTMDNPWLWGARLLKRLHDEYSVPISLLEVQEEFILRVRDLYHPERVPPRVSHRWHPHAKPRMLPQHFLQSWYELWGDLIPIGEKLVLNEEAIPPAALGLRARRAERAKKKRRKVGVGAVDDIESRRYLEEHLIQ